MKLHILGVPHTITTKEYLCCAFTQKVLKFCKMMQGYDYTLIHYGHEASEVECDERVTVTTDSTLKLAYGDYDWRKEFFKHSMDDFAHKTFYANAVPEIQKRAEYGDAVLCFWGCGHKPVADALDETQLAIVEPGIGYPSVFSSFRVFESYAKMNQTYGELGCMPGWYDAVIPNYFDLEDFEYQERKDGYLMFLGRLIPNKGVDIAVQVAEKLGKRLVVAGQGDICADLGYESIPDCVDYVGSVGVEERKRLLAGAQALLAPTHYNEPFGGVTVEAMLSGTPVICTDWGAFPENVVHGRTGYRCRTVEQFLWAARNIGSINPKVCREWAEQFSLENVAPRYDEYFQMVSRVFTSGGFYSENPERKQLDWMNRPYETLTQISTPAAPAYVEEGHLGGYIRGGDSWTWEPHVWQFVLDECGDINTVVDVGAGEGHAARWFAKQGLDVTAIEGSLQACQDSVFPLIHHDYTTGPLTVQPADLVYSCEFVEHVEARYAENFLTTFACGRYVLMTYADEGQPGYHHVNLQHWVYWVHLMQSIGYEFDKGFTDRLRQVATHPHLKTRSLFFRQIT